jgi:RNA polymerase sigma factor (TIGR02999 family)
VTSPLSDSSDNAASPTPAGRDDLLAGVYDSLRALAAGYLKGERRGHTLQPTALVHEAYLRLAELDRIQWKDPAHFFAAAAGAIRRVLVDHARARGAAKRGGGAARLTLTGLDAGPEEAPLDLLALDEALERLAGLDPRKARVVELRFFGGLTIAQTAESLGVGPTTVEDDWAFARSWLRRAR